MVSRSTLRLEVAVRDCFGGIAADVTEEEIVDVDSPSSKPGMSTCIRQFIKIQWHANSCFCPSDIRLVPMK
jgi:hypothetical protein